ncbi:MAG TPA: thiamine phosphate synthase [Granulicella sp.]
MLRYAITDRSVFAAGSEAGPETRFGALIARCVQLAQSGVDLLQVREKDLPPEDLAELSRRLLAAVRAVGGPTRVLLNSRVDLALSIGADGVHLSSAPGQASPEEIRLEYRRAGLPEPFVSVSCHSLDEVRRAREMKASAVLFGPVFGKTLDGEQVVAPVGLEALRAACLEAGAMPVLALGGVTPERVQSCLDAGAAGVAAIRMFLAGEL